MFSDPFMNTLFDMTHPESNVSPEDHGKRLALFFLSFFGGENSYQQLRGKNTHPIQLLETSH